MGILSVVKTDVEELVKGGFSNEYISRSVGVEKSIIDYIVNYVKPQAKNSLKINNKDSNKGG